jgi:hypothetical protein
LQQLRRAGIKDQTAKHTQRAKIRPADFAVAQKKTGAA